jgi:hypothetical protein
VAIKVAQEDEKARKKAKRDEWKNDKEGLKRLTK